MSTDWVAVCIASAQKAQASFPKGVITPIEQMLSGPASEKEMKGPELNAVAIRLLEAMAAVRKKAGK